MELIIHSPSEDGFVKKIDWNHEEIKKELNIKLQEYKGLVYTEDSIKEARNDRATLNKFKEAIENKRKEIKKQCLLPYENFELRVKEILVLVDEPVGEIDKQIKGFESKTKEDKRLVLEGVYTENIDNLKDVLPLAKIWDDKFLNATVTVKKASQEIMETIEKVKADLEVIQNLGSEFELQVKDKYLQTLDMSLALKEKTRLEEQKAKLELLKAQEEQKKKEEAERKALAEKERAEKVARMKEKQGLENPIKVIDIPVHIVPQETVPVKIVSEQPEQPKLEEITFRVWVTPEQKLLLKNFVIENQIKIGKVV